MRHVIAGVGKVLVTLGLLLLLFVAYQLWGTGIYTARAQNRLEKQFQQSLSSTTTRPPTTVTTGTDDPVVGTTTTTLAPPVPPDPADTRAVAHIVIPKIGVDATVVEGVSDGDLREGPGHYPATPFPGQVGNSAIAGHRTTYGAPFGELDSLEEGDLIQVTTVQGTFEYRVYAKEVVSPSASEVLLADPAHEATLTLTTCHPRFSAAQRLIVHGTLVVPQGSAPLPSSVDPNDVKVQKADLANALTGESGPLGPTVISGIILAIVGGLWWLLFHRHPRWTTWLVGLVPFAVALGAFYYLLERALPSNY